MNTKFNLILVGSIAATITSSQAVHTLLYEFDDAPLGAIADGTPITNSGSVGGPGTFHPATGSGSIINTGVVTGTAYGDVFLGRTLLLSPPTDGTADLNAPHIDANAAVALFGITPSTEYTAFAWVNMNSSSGDNMIFGGSPAPALHHGTRNGNVQSGHWGDDAGPDQGLIIPVPNGQWHVLAYTNDTAGVQTIFLDPGTPSQVNLSNGAATNGQMNTAINLLIGTAPNGGSFSGQMDRVYTYDSIRTPEQIAAAAVVPEPTTFLALASGATVLLGLRRRRS